MQDNNDKTREIPVLNTTSGTTREIPAAVPEAPQEAAQLRSGEAENHIGNTDFAAESKNPGYTDTSAQGSGDNKNESAGADEIFIRSGDTAGTPVYYVNTPDYFSHSEQQENGHKSHGEGSDTGMNTAAADNREKSAAGFSADPDATQFVEVVSPSAEFSDTADYSGTKTAVSDTPSVRQGEAPRKRGRIWIPILSSSLVIILACMAVLSSYVLSMIRQNGIAGGIAEIITPMMGTAEPPKYTNVLLVGTDEEGYRTDTIMVATYDNETESVNVIQIPRDTYVAGNGRRDKKVNSAYFSGIDNLKDEIFLALGIEVHKYVAVELKGFVEMVDALGGVEFDVPINMNYDDPTQNLHIHIKKGLQTLDGKNAEGLVRYRKSNDGTSYPRGDLDRMQVQREFIMKLIEKAVSINGLGKIPELLEIAQKNVQTDIPYSEAYSYVTKLLSIDKANIKFFDTPGAAEYKYGGWYYFVDGAETRDIVSQYFYGDRNKKNHVVSSVPASSSKNSAPESHKDISDDERYTYYTATEKPSSSPHAVSSPSPTPKTSSSEKPSSSHRPDSSAAPHASATPAATPETASPAPAESTKPSSTPQIIIKPTAAPQDEASE